jgi:RNA polymerase sigma-70 factor (ECF subfamily)
MTTNLADEQFEKLALEQMDTLYRVAKRLTRNPDSASDLVQETFVRALRARDSFELKEYGIRPWLLRIMHNLHYSRSTRESRQPVKVDDEALEATENANTPDAEATLAPLNFDDLDERLAKALETLPVDYQIVLLMWAVDDLSYKEIGKTLDIPIGTVMSRLHRARQKLAQQLRDYALEEGVIKE